MSCFMFNLFVQVRKVKVTGTNIGKHYVGVHYKFNGLSGIQNDMKALLWNREIFKHWFQYCNDRI